MLIPFKCMPVRAIKGIIHIGAHEAEELSDYQAGGIARVLWVEANPSKWSLLEQRLSGFPLMHLGRFAASSKSGGFSLLNIANNGQSSSMLAMGTHAVHHPDIQYDRQESVDLVAVDDWIDQLGEQRERLNFVNLDVQGYELQALRGLQRQLRFADYVYTEVNFEEVYSSCALVADLDAYLGACGFSRVALVDTGAGWGDALYAKRNIAWLRLRYNFLFMAKNIIISLRRIARLSLKF